MLTRQNAVTRPQMEELMRAMQARQIQAPQQRPVARRLSFSISIPSAPLLSDDEKKHSSDYLTPTPIRLDDDIPSTPPAPRKSRATQH